jgi:hypothetical protein
MSQEWLARAMMSCALSKLRQRSRTSLPKVGWRAVIMLALLVGLVRSFPSVAGENTAYSYDALGRLIKTSHSGTVNNGTSSCYAYDHASNRTNVKVATATDCNNPGVGVSFSISSNGPVIEGATSVFTVTKTGTASGTLTVDYGTASGSATSGSDFTATSGTLTFLAGDTSKTFSVPTIDDTVFEGAETFTGNLSNPSGSATIGTGSATATINDNDSAPSFVISDASTTEGGNLVFTVTKSGSTSSSFTVNYATANGSAIAGSDYTATSGTLTFGPADSSLTITVPTINDSVAEATENMTVNLSGASGGATITDPQGIGTITDNDVPSFSVNNVSVTEGGNLVFGVTMTGQTAINFSVNYATANGTATAGSDYTAASGTLTFGPSSAASVTQNVTVATIDDTISEPNETVMLNLSGATGGATISTSQGTGTIIDNDPTCAGVSFAVSDASVVEGGVLGFTVTKTGSPTINCSVNFATANGSAVAPGDYTAASGTLTFTPSQTSQTVSVTTFSNGISPEGTRTMTLNLSGASSSATISDAQGVGTLFDDGVVNCQVQFCDPGPIGLATMPRAASPAQTRALR